MNRYLIASLTFSAFVLGCSATADPAAQPAPATTETIVILRHGEKTATELGQLDVQGLNRSLALPAVLKRKFGTPTAIYAPDPAQQIGVENSDASYSYVRPLATIEPTAIQLGMPVNTQYGFTDIKHLERAITAPAYASATVYVCWEHGYAERLAKRLLKDNDGDDKAVPHWSGSDFDSLYIIRISHSSGGAVTATFTHDYEGLNGEPSSYPPSSPPLTH